MTLGEKIRSLRKERKMTQAALCGDFMTRNMQGIHGGPDGIGAVRFSLQQISHGDSPFFIFQRYFL
jgi:transcriptional regulator with XRE-family HTH domain